MPGSGIVYCFCPDHIDGAPRRFEGHSFRLVRDPATERYRWGCTCGGTGTWQSDPRSNPPYHLWLTHVGSAKPAP